MYFLLDGFYRPFASVQFKPSSVAQSHSSQTQVKMCKSGRTLEKWPDYLTAQQSLLAAQRDFLSLEARTSKWFKYTNRGKKEEGEENNKKTNFFKKRKGVKEGKGL